MGYGNLQGTFNIGIVETDVQSIVQGITGYNGRTLTDIENDLSYYLYSSGYSAAELLYYIYNQMGSLGGGNVENYLSGSWYGVLYDGTSAVTYLNWISSNTGSLQGYLAGWNGGPLTDIDGNTNWTANNTSNIANYLYDGNSAVSYLNWINSNLGSIQSLLSGSWGGPLTNIDSNTSSTAGNTSYLYNIDSAISTVRDYLYDWNSYQSVATILNDIRNCLQQLSFDGNGRLLVSTN